MRAATEKRTFQGGWAASLKSFAADHLPVCMADPRFWDRYRYSPRVPVDEHAYYAAVRSRCEQHDCGMFYGPTR